LARGLPVRPDGAKRMAFSAFLSHRYRSPETNIFFFNLFAGIAQVQFSVDRGTFATNVTRLERLVRDADAFVGIYPFPGRELEGASRKDLEKESRYFRLELDLAERSGKPAIAFIDERYRNVIDPPPSIIQCRFKWQEISEAAPSGDLLGFEDSFRQLCQQVDSARRHGRTRAVARIRRTEVGLMLPPKDASGSGYSAADVDGIVGVIEEIGARSVVMQWPPRLDADLATRIHHMDWVVVDLGPQSALTGIAPYLHGRFIPAVRLQQVNGDDANGRPPVAVTLYGAHEVGYFKDIVHWHDSGTLLYGVKDRVASIAAERQRVATSEEAETYFRGASLRKESVFISYSGRDLDIAVRFVKAMKNRFQEVFDYRDGQAAIPAGAPWLETVFRRLAASPLAIPLLSHSYFESGNCRHEGMKMVEERDAGRVKVIPVKLIEGPLDLPPWISSDQYLRLWEYSDMGAAVSDIIASLDRPT